VGEVKFIPFSPLISSGKIVFWYNQYTGSKLEGVVAEVFYNS